MQVSANGISIEVDDQGPAGGPPVLLIMGLGMQLIGWPDELVHDLVGRGHRVLRLDNRDAGLSQGFDALGVPKLMWLGLRYAMHLPVHAPYGLKDMAADTLGVIDALGLPSVHVVGASMGGMIAQHLAADHPRRVRSLTLIMTTSGARGLPQASPAVRRALLRRPASQDPAVVAAHLQRFFHLIASPAYPTDPERLRRRVQQSVARAWRPAGPARQVAAVVADGDRTPLLDRIVAPTGVIHGDADTLVPVAAGHDLARRIRGAVLDIVPGMGHDLPLQVLPRLAADIAETVARAAA